MHFLVVLLFLEKLLCCFVFYYSLYLNPASQPIMTINTPIYHNVFCLSMAAWKTSSFRIESWNFNIDTYMWISQNGISQIKRVLRYCPSLMFDVIKTLWAVSKPSIYALTTNVVMHLSKRFFFETPAKTIHKNGNAPCQRGLTRVYLWHGHYTLASLSFYQRHSSLTQNTIFRSLEITSLSVF